MWQPDGAILFAPNAVGPLFRVPSSGGTAVAATKLEPGQNDHRAPFLLPDGRHFLYYSRGTPQVRGVYVAAARRIRIAAPRRRRRRRGLRLGSPAVRPSGELLAQPFDAHRLTLGGAAFRVAGPVAVSPAISLASLAASPAGASGTRPVMSRAGSSYGSIERARRSSCSGSRSRRRWRWPPSRRTDDGSPSAGPSAELGHLADGHARNDEPVDVGSRSGHVSAPVG